MKKWSLKKTDISDIQNLMRKGGITALTASVLASRGYTDIESAARHLEVSELTDPFLIADMENAVEAINSAVDEGEKICIYGDYDCDGVVASVMLYTFLQEIGADVIYCIPERDEGYGMNETAIRELAEQGVNLIITVDNGIAAVNEAELIYELGMKLVITDHHQPGEILPRAEAIVDPHRKDCFSPFKMLCGAGVVLKLIAALNEGDYSMAMEQFGDLAAIATVADVVELTGENRFIVKYGLEMLKNTERPGLIALIAVSGLTGKPLNSVSIGFMLAPRINSAGRFGSPKTAAELLLEEDEVRAHAIAYELNELNEKRKEVEALIFADIYRYIAENPQSTRERVLLFCGENWHHGVIGIIASRLQERFGKPCFIFANNNGDIRGSARSFGDFSIFKALQYASDFLERYGGHSGAGGFTVKPEFISEFKDKVLEYAKTQYNIMPPMPINIDAQVSPNELTVDNVKGLKVLEPYGIGNETPLFYLDKAAIIGSYPMSGGQHTKLRLKLDGKLFDALIFRVAPEDTGLTAGDVCNLIVSLDINLYNGTESISIIVKDYRNSGIKQQSVFSALDAYERFLRDEEIPEKYYVNMLPTYEELKTIYKGIPERGIATDTLYANLIRQNINYCKVLVAANALSELGLIITDFASDKLSRIKATKKADINSATVLKKLKQLTVG